MYVCFCLSARMRDSNGFNGPFPTEFALLSRLTYLDLIGPGTLSGDVPKLPLLTTCRVVRAVLLLCLCAFAQ